MIKTNIILKKKHTLLHIKTKEEKDYIITHCSIESTLNQTSMKNSFKCNKDISLSKYREKLNSEVIPMLRDFEILMQGV